MHRKVVIAGAAGLACLVPLTALAQAAAAAAQPASAASAPAAAPAEAPPAGTAPGQRQEVQQVIVTAQKRKDDIRDVPLAVSVVTGEQLQTSRSTTSRT